MLKRISLSMLAIAIVSALVTSASFALFTSTAANQNNNFATGDVTLGAPTGTQVNVTNLAPGDTSANHPSGAATYTVSYVGSLDAWVGVKIQSSGDLFTCDGGKFTADVSDGTSSYAFDQADYQSLGEFSNGESVTLTTTWGLDILADDDCEDTSASIDIHIVAVQSRNNTNGAGDGPINWN